MLELPRHRGWADADAIRCSRHPSPRLRWSNDTWVSALAALTLAVWTVAVHVDGRPDGDAARSRPAHASTPNDRPRVSAQPEHQFAFYGGVPHTIPSDIVFEKAGATNLTVHEVEWEGRPFKSPIYYGLRALRWPGDVGLGAMLDFTHSKAIGRRDQRVRFSGIRNGRQVAPSATIGETFRHLEFSHGHNMLTINGLWRLGQIMPRVLPYLGGGFGVALPHTEIQFTDETRRTYEYQYTGPVGQALAGVELRLNANVSVFIEYKFTLARYVAPLTGYDSRHGWGYDDFPRQLLLWWRGIKPEMGTASTTLASHQMIGGVILHHGGGPASQ